MLETGLTFREREAVEDVRDLAAAIGAVGSRRITAAGAEPAGAAAGVGYTRGQALGVLAPSELRRRGVSWRRMRTAAGVLPPIVEHEHAYLVFDGWLMHSRRTDTEVVELVPGLGRGCQVLRLRKLAERLRQS